LADLAHEIPDFRDSLIQRSACSARQSTALRVSFRFFR
jgi:hypothetical protein